MKIIRTWKGWTTKENANAYRAFLKNEVFPSVKASGINGLNKVSISSKDSAVEVEFFLMLEFESLADVKAFAGENYETAFIPEKAKTLLKRYDTKAEHFELNDSFRL